MTSARPTVEIPRKGRCRRPTRFNPHDFIRARAAIWTRFFGSPDLNVAQATVQSVMAVVDLTSETDSTLKNSTRYANYLEILSERLSRQARSISVTDTFYPRSAYQHTTNRENISSIRPTSSTSSRPDRYPTRPAFGTEFGRQFGHRSP